MSSTATATNSIAAALIAELENEGAVTRKVLQRCSADKFHWKPHDKSMTFGRLASHLAEMHGWTKYTVEQPELDILVTVERQIGFLAGARVDVVEQQENAHPAIGGPDHLVEHQPAGPVVVPEVVHQVEAMDGAAGGEHPRGEGFAIIGNEP